MKPPDFSIALSRKKNIFISYPNYTVSICPEQASERHPALGEQSARGVTPFNREGPASVRSPFNRFRFQAAWRCQAGGDREVMGPEVLERGSPVPLRREEGEEGERRAPPRGARGVSAPAPGPASRPAPGPAPGLPGRRPPPVRPGAQLPRPRTPRRCGRRGGRPRAQPARRPRGHCLRASAAGSGGGAASPSRARPAVCPPAGLGRRARCAPTSGGGSGPGAGPRASGERGRRRRRTL